MKKSLFMRIWLIPMAVLIVIGITIIGILAVHSSEIGTIEVELEDGKPIDVSFDALGLIPGESVDYTVILDGDLDYELNISFRETEKAEDKGMTPLKNFAYAMITVDDEIICHGLLADLFEGEEFNLSVSFSEEKNTRLKVVYYLPSEVGNEAENAVAYFDLKIKPINYANPIEN